MTSTEVRVRLCHPGRVLVLLASSVFLDAQRTPLLQDQNKFREMSPKPLFMTIFLDIQHYPKLQQEKREPWAKAESVRLFDCPCLRFPVAYTHFLQL